VYAREGGEGRKGKVELSIFPPFLPCFRWTQDVTSERESLLAEVKGLKSPNSTLQNRVVFLEGEVERLKTKEGREGGGEERFVLLSPFLVSLLQLVKEGRYSQRALTSPSFSRCPRSLDLDPSLDFSLARPSSLKLRPLSPRPRSSQPRGLDPQLLK